MECTEGARNFEKSSNMTRFWQKNEEKPCSTCLKHIFRLIMGLKIPIRVHDPARHVLDFQRCDTIAIVNTIVGI